MTDPISTTASGSASDREPDPSSGLNVLVGAQYDVPPDQLNMLYRYFGNLLKAEDSSQSPNEVRLMKVDQELFNQALNAMYDGLGRKAYICANHTPPADPEAFLISVYGFDAVRTELWLSRSETFRDLKKRVSTIRGKCDLERPKRRGRVTPEIPDDMSVWEYAVKGAEAVTVPVTTQDAEPSSQSAAIHYFIWGEDVVSMAMPGMSEQDSVPADGQEIQTHHPDVPHCSECSELYNHDVGSLHSLYEFADKYNLPLLKDDILQCLIATDEQLGENLHMDPIWMKKAYERLDHQDLLCQYHALRFGMLYSFHGNRPIGCEAWSTFPPAFRARVTWHRTQMAESVRRYMDEDILSDDELYRAWVTFDRIRRVFNMIRDGTTEISGVEKQAAVVGRRVQSPVPEKEARNAKLEKDMGELEMAEIVGLPQKDAEVTAKAEDGLGK